MATGAVGAHCLVCGKELDLEKTYSRAGGDNVYVTIACFEQYGSGKPWNHVVAIRRPNGKPKANPKAPPLRGGIHLKCWEKHVAGKIAFFDDGTPRS